MCLLAFACDRHPDYRLMLLGNRDEFHRRPTAASAWWAEAPQVLAGRDLQGGGTWMGVTRQGRWAALTNVRDPAQHREGRPSRGPLVADFLRGSQAPEAYLHALRAQAPDYNGFNLLVGVGSQVWALHSPSGTVREPGAGVHGLSNADLDTPWPKLNRLTDWLAQQRQGFDWPAAWVALGNRVPVPDAALPDTGVGLDWERLLATPFICSPDYGTRSSTVLLIGYDGTVSWCERSFAPDGTVVGEVTHTFGLDDGSNMNHGRGAG